MGDDTSQCFLERHLGHFQSPHVAQDKFFRLLKSDRRLLLMNRGVLNRDLIFRLRARGLGRLELQVDSSLLLGKLGSNDLELVRTLCELIQRLLCALGCVDLGVGRRRHSAI